MRRTAKLELQVSCQRKRWTIAVGNHRNILVFYSRYPLDGSIDLGDFSSTDFERLFLLFKNRERNTKAVASYLRWTFEFDGHCNLLVKFTHFPFSGSIELGEISKESSQQLASMFAKAQHL